MYKIIEYNTVRDLEHSPSYYDIILFETDECKRVVWIDGRSYFLSIPPMLFKIRASKVRQDVYLLGSAKSAFCVNNILYDVPFPNTYRDGFICLGEERIVGVDKEELIERFLKYYWGSNFIEESGSSYNYRKYKLMGFSFEDWGFHSKYGGIFLIIC